MSRYIYILFFFVSVCGISQEQTIITSRHIGDNAYKQALLVLKYEPLDSNSVVFKRGVSKAQLNDFVLKENKALRSNNKALSDVFKKHYIFDYRLISKDQLEKLDVKQYPYVLIQSPVKLVKNNKDAEKGTFTYSYYVFDRKKDKRLADINAISNDRWQALKVVVQELGIYLQEKEYQALYE